MVRPRTVPSLRGPSTLPRKVNGVGVLVRKEYVYSAFEFALQTRTSVMARDHAALLPDLHDLRAVAIIRAFRVNRPIAGNISWRLLYERGIDGDE